MEYEISKALFEKARRMRQEAKDGDGDGVVFDGTPQERPVVKNSMDDLAIRVRKQMSRAENRKAMEGDVQTVAWVAERVLDLNEDQAIRVAEKIVEQIKSGK